MDQNKGKFSDNIEVHIIFFECAPAHLLILHNTSGSTYIQYGVQLYSHIMDGIK